MSIITAGVLIIIGFLLLIKGADWLVNGASSLAKKNNISDLAIGLTIVAFGTSAPELVVNTIASFNNQPDIILGNVIGSNNFNLFVILGIVGLIYPISVQSTTAWREIPISLAAIIVSFFLANEFVFQNDTTLSRFEGIFLFLLFILFLFYVFKQLKTDESQISEKKEVLSNSRIWIYILIGLGGLVFGGKLVVDSAIELASSFGVSKKIIGLTIIAAGTSLPELVTSIVAAMKKNSDIAIGNVIGSNIFNLFLVLSISSIVNPLQYNVVFNTEFYLLFSGTIFLLIAMLTGKRKKLDRWEAGILLAIFVGYTFYLIVNEL
jgi:cation:H+ antiporter